MHIVVPELFLPREAAAQACAGMALPALEQLLARADAQPLAADSLEAWMCAAFGVDDGAVAPVMLLADGGTPGDAYWLRADPVHLMLRGSEMILRPLSALDAGEAGQLCEALNRHFAGQGLQFIAPHPLRWYLRLDQAPEVVMHSLAQVAGRDARHFLPHGPGALAWHKLFNEIQMVLYGHPVNDAREARGEWSINSIWPWGGGRAPEAFRSAFASMHAASVLADAFAAAAGIAHIALSDDNAQTDVAREGGTLVVWEGLAEAAQQGDLDAWRAALQALEYQWMRPMLRALRQRRIERLTLDVLHPGQAWRFTLTPRTAWRFWRWRRRVSQYPAALGKNKI
jgi:hypothetical protein